MEPTQLRKTLQRRQSSNSLQLNDIEKEEIESAVLDWYNSPTKAQPSPRLRTTATRLFSITRGHIQLRQKSKSQVTITVNFMFEKVEKERVNDTASFYLSQTFPEFPYRALVMLLEREETFGGVVSFLLDRGWEMKNFSAGELNAIIPDYYFGKWSYDCLFAFEGNPAGSYMTCFNENKYYAVYKDIQGSLISAGFSILTFGCSCLSGFK
jgi:hypothetical protein